MPSNGQLAQGLTLQIQSEHIKFEAIYKPYPHSNMPRYENTVCAGALVLLCFTDKSTAEISQLTKIGEHRLHILKSTAIKHGFDPSAGCQIFEYFVEDAPCSGRPKEITPIQEQQIIDSITADCAGQEKSAEVLGFEAGISMSSTLRILKQNGFSSKKPTTKPGLTDIARQQRLQFTLQHRD